MAKTLTEIQRDSDKKRGVVSKSYKLSLEFVKEIEQIAQEKGISQKELLVQALAAYKKQEGIA